MAMVKSAQVVLQIGVTCIPRRSPGNEPERAQLRTVLALAFSYG